MTPEEAYEWIRGLVRLDVGRFYGPANGLSLGAGLICKNVLFPIFDQKEGVFLTARGLVYVVTHECDIEQGNVRPFNDDVLVCPIIPFELLVARLGTHYDNDDLKAYLGHLAARNLYRLTYWPPLPAADLPFGAVLFMNRITHTHISAFDAPAVPVGALSAYGLQEMDRALQNHLFREKDEALPLSRRAGAA